MGRPSVWRTLPPTQRTWLVLVALAAMASLTTTPYPAVAPLHHLPTLALIGAAPWLLRRWPLGDRSVACIGLFLLLHTLGGHFTYTNLPYDDWTRALTGTSLGEAMGWRRNHYDRLVHLAFGLLAVPPLTEGLRRHGGLGPRAAGWGAVAGVMAIGAVYEIFEWLLAIAVAGPAADSYNGQQGDVWDAQKDMGLALAGALAALAWGRYGRRKHS